MNIMIRKYYDIDFCDSKGSYTFWINVKDRLPNKIGWYKIKSRYGEFEAPFVHNGRGELVWLLPDPSIITHWENKYLKI